MREDLQRRFDALVEEAIGQLPEDVVELLDEVPVVVEDTVPEAIRAELGSLVEDASEFDEFCGLHSGLSNIEESVEHSAEMPSMIHLFREGIVSLAGGWDQPEADDEVFEEIWITLCHEIGHQFGLDEDDLLNLGYD